MLINIYSELAHMAFYHANVQFDYEALFAGVQRKATLVTTAVPDGANGHSNVVQSDIECIPLSIVLQTGHNGCSMVR